MPVEEQLLPHKDLSVYYNKVTWLYVCRTFKQDAKDLEALRTHDRVGVSSWPQMFLLDPVKLRKLAAPARQLPRFKRAFDEVLAAWQGRQAPTQEARTASIASSRQDRARTLDLERALAAAAPPGDKLLAEAGAWVEDAARDPVLRQRSLQLLAAKSPQRLEGKAAALLTDLDLDPWRYAVMEYMAAHPQPEDDRSVLRLMAEVGGQRPSLNPNVVRIRAVNLLARIGGSAAFTALLPQLRDADPRMALTRLLPDALAQIAGRQSDAAVARLRPALIAALPPAAEAGEGREAKFRARLALAQVRAILKALARLGPAPKAPRVWDSAARKALLASLGA